MNEDKGLKAEFAEIVRDLDATSHGSASWRRVAQFFQDRFGKSQQRLDFLAHHLLRPPVEWEDARHELWPGDDKKQTDNRFHFLQGDLIRTELVASWVSATGAQLQVFGADRATHDLWLVLSPDCDAVRSELVSVAPAFVASKEELAIAFALRSPHRFPLPRLTGDPQEVLARYADLARLSLLDCRDGRRGLPQRLASLTEVGWHLLNAQLIQHVSRAEEKADAVRLRNLPERDA